MSKASIYFFPKLEKKNARTGKVPIYLRIIINRCKAETRLSCDVEEAELQLWNPRIMRFENNKIGANKVLNKYQQEFEDLIFRYARELSQITAKDLRDELLGHNKSGETILGFVWEYYWFVINYQEH